MELILKEDVPSLGKAGDVVRVSPGFGRNYLLPNKKAVEASKANLKYLEVEKKNIEAKRAKLKQEAEELAAKLNEVTITLQKQAGEEDKIFGSVSTREIADALKAAGFTIDKRNIVINAAMKKLGDFSVSIHLHHDVIVPLKISLIKKI